MYQRSIVTFVDILGFKEIVRSWPAERIKTVLDILRRVNRHEDFPRDHEFDARVLQFSDSIIRVRPLAIGDEIAHPNTFIGEFGDLAFAQLLMLRHGVCMRGAITVGDVYVSSSGAFGPAFNRAYELESTLAKHPRIVVDHAILTTLPASSDEDTGLPSVRDLCVPAISIGEDGVPWLDYFSWLLRFDGDNNGGLENYLSNHRKLILENASGRTAIDSVVTKYLWLARYHNRVIDTLPSSVRAHLDFDVYALRIGHKEVALLAGAD